MKCEFKVDSNLKVIWDEIENVGVRVVNVIVKICRVQVILDQL